jgi:hypothetical protein
MSRYSKLSPTRQVLFLAREASTSAIDALIDKLKEIKAAKIQLEKLLAEDIPSVRRGRGRPSKQGFASRGDGLAEPRPGSLRAMIHAYLKEKGATKTNDLVKALTARLGKKAGPSLRVRINQVLINKRDPFIRKLGRGHYAYRG